MLSFARSSLLVILLASICITNSCSSVSHDNQTTTTAYDDFLIVDHLSDNEKETRVKWKDLMGKETSLEMEDVERYANSSLHMTSLWQLSDGKTFAQLIFGGGGSNLLDCEILTDGEQIASEFVSKFMSDYAQIHNEKFGSSKHMRHHHWHESSNLQDSFKPNSTIVQLKRLQDIPEHFLELLNLRKLKKSCRQLHKQVKRQARDAKVADDELDEQINQRTKRQADSWFIAPNTKWCGKGTNSQRYSELGASKGDACCRRHDHCKLNVPGLQTRFGLFNVRPFAISHCRCDRRRRRRDLNNLLIVPHTRWCGPNGNAKKYSEIGGYSRSDKCCRSHDYCPHWILGLKNKWQLFNWSVNTIMHCKCDERFRTCLKMASDDTNANLVGKLFFNIVQIKCFVLKPEKACILHSWWGKCLKYKIKKRAYLRENKKF